MTYGTVLMKLFNLKFISLVVDPQAWPDLIAGLELLGLVLVAHGLE